MALIDVQPAMHVAINTTPSQRVFFRPTCRKIKAKCSTVFDVYPQNKKVKIKTAQSGNTVEQRPTDRSLKNTKAPPIGVTVNYTKNKEQGRTKISNESRIFCLIKYYGNNEWV